MEKIHFADLWILDNIYQPIYNKFWDITGYNQFWLGRTCCFALAIPTFISAVLDREFIAMIILGAGYFLNIFPTIMLESIVSDKFGFNPGRETLFFARIITFMNIVFWTFLSMISPNHVILVGVIGFIGIWLMDYFCSCKSRPRKPIVQKQEVFQGNFVSNWM